MPCVPILSLEVLLYVPSRVPLSLYQSFQEIIPLEKNNPRDILALGFLDYITLSPWIDRDDKNRIVCSAEIMHSFDNTLHLVTQKRSEVRPRLEHLQNVLDPHVTFSIHAASTVAGKATSISVQFSPELKRLLQERRQAIRNGQDDTFVSVLTGKARTVRESKALRQAYLEQGRAAVAQAHAATHPLREELEYLNSRPSNTFAPLEKRFPAVLESIRKLKSESLDNNFRILEQLRIHPQPLYKAVGNSPRLYTLMSGVQNMSKSVRRELFAGCVSLDLEAAQFAIVAAKWGIPEIQQALAGAGAWQVILEEFHHHYPSLTKEQVKSVLYPLIFGMPEFTLKQRIQEYSHISPERFLAASPTFRALLSARKKQMSEIRKAGHVVDAFGIPHTVSERKASGMRGDKAIRSLLAYEAQSYEALLMQAAIQAIRQEERYVRPVLLIHDGVYLQFTGEANAQKQAKTLLFIQDAVDAVAAKSGIITRLVQE